MNRDFFHEGDKVLVRQRDSDFYNVPQTVVGFAGDYVRVRLDEPVAGMSTGLVSSWLPESLHRIDPRTVPLYKRRTHLGGMEILSDPQYQQVWVTPIAGTGERSQEFHMDLKAVTELRDVLDAWLKRQE